MLMFSLLICVVSLVLQSPISLNIHNQCKDIKLTSPVYFIHGGIWHTVPDHTIDVDAIMRNQLEFDSGQDILDGILLYKIQRQHTESDKLVQAESKNIQLLVAWHVEPTKELNVCALLIEHDKEFDEDKLKRLHQKYWYLLDAWVNPVGINWLLNDTTMLETTIKVMNGGYRWDIFISGGVESIPRRPLWIDTER
jgi:hypothetical protein